MPNVCYGEVSIVKGIANKPWHTLSVDCVFSCVQELLTHKFIFQYIGASSQGGLGRPPVSKYMHSIGTCISSSGSLLHCGAADSCS